jgi:N5-(cytidine 5'-diphosphoramidyl)-L-glutamine hydrolase
MVDARYSERRDALDQRWAQFLAAAGMAGVALPNAPELAAQLADRSGIAGIVLTGGDDLAEYGGQAPERDATERTLLQWSQQRKKPLLGICRGMQAIQHVHGVRLHQGEGHVAQTHYILIDGRNRSVNSYHNLVARDSVADLPVWALAPDGAIEAIRHRNLRLAGIMWHPERNTPFDPLDIEFFRSFFGATS